MSLRSLAIAAVLPACLLKPSPPSGEAVNDAPMSDSNGSGSGSGSDPGSGSSGSGSDGMPMIPRLLSIAYYSDTEHTQGMSTSGYSIPAGGIHDGDLVILIANIDNGSDGDILSPAGGFTQLYDTYYGSGDGQTYFAAYKIANNEPPTYTGGYMSTGGSRAAAMSLIAISGVDPANPINFNDAHIASGYQDSPTAVVTGGSDATTIANCAVIVAAGADWENSDGGTEIVQGFSGASSLAILTDEGSNATTLEWTSLAVGWFPQTVAGSLGNADITLHSDGAEDGEPWGIAIAVAPKP